MSTDLHLLVPFHPAEVEDLILNGLPAKLAPFLKDEAEEVLFRFEGEIVAGHASKDRWPWSDDVLGGPFSVPYSILFGFPRTPRQYAVGIPQILRVTASILKARTEDVLLTHDASPMLLRRGGVVTLSNGGYWTPAYLEALGISGPMRPLWAGDEGWDTGGVA